MPAENPSPAQVWRAIEVYLQAAYPGPAPSAVRTRLEALRNTSDTDFFNSDIFERDKNDPNSSKRSLRLGNRVYPHMKMVIEPSPDGRSQLFRADTHDRHVRPAPESKEYAMFCQLMEMNQQLASAIETAWSIAGVPTFKDYLRRDLAARQIEANTKTP